MKKIFILLSATLLSIPFAQAERLVLVSASYGKNILAITDDKGDVLWSYKTAGGERGHSGHHDVHLLPNGNILFHDSWQKTSEITLDKEIVWTYNSATANGNNGKRVDVHAFDRLPNGNTIIVESAVGRIIEVDPSGKLISQFPLKEGGTKSTRLMRITPEGNYLVCSENPGIVVEYSPKGEIVWEHLINTRVYGALRLSSGNTLIASGSGNSIVEVSPDNKVVWEIAKTVPNTDIQLHWTTCLEERSNGNYMIGNCHAGDKNPQIFEINPKTNEVVWEFDEFELVGNGLAIWQVLDDKQSKMVRKKLAAQK